MNLSENTWLVSQSQQKSSSLPGMLLTRVKEAVDHIGAVWLARRQRSQDLQVLYTSSDRELRDMGLNRTDIPGIANGLYRQG